MKTLKSLICFCLLLFLILPIAYAKDYNVKIVKVELDSKSDNTEVVNDVSFDNMVVKSKVNFFNQGDYVIYKITVKNNDSVNYVIDKITDDNTNTELKYEFEYDKTLKHESEKEILLKITYTSLLSPDASLDTNNVYSSESEVNISLNLSESTFDILNPSTYDQINLYFLIELIGLITLLVTFVVLKIRNKSVIVILLLFMIPHMVHASFAYKITFKVSNEIDIKISFLDKDWKTKVTGDYTKIEFKKTTDFPANAVDVSEELDGSVKAWLENDTVYIGSKYKIFFPIDSGELLSKSDVTSIKFNNIDTFFTESMFELFYNDSALSALDVSKFNTSKVKSMINMFNGVSNVKKLDLSTFDTSNVTNMSNIFSNMDALENINLDGWDMTHASYNSIGGMFYQSGNIKTISAKKWKLPEHTYYVLTCNGAASLCSENLQSIDVSNWDLSNTRSLNRIFAGTKTREIKGLNTWDTSNLNNINELFDNCENIEELNLDGWDLSKLYNNSNGSLRNMTSLKKISAKNWKLPQDFSYEIGSNLIRDTYTPVEEIDVTGWDLTDTKDISGVFTRMYYLKKIKGLNTWDTSNITSMRSLFYRNYVLEEVDLSGWDTSNVTDMNCMFYMNQKLTHLDLSSFDTSNVTNMQFMFAYDYNLRSLDLSNFETENVTDFGYMFDCDYTLRDLDISNFTINATYTSSFFNKNYGLVYLKTPKVNNATYDITFTKKLYSDDNIEYSKLPSTGVTLNAKKEAYFEEGSSFNSDLKMLNGSNPIKHFKRSKTFPIMDFYYSTQYNYNVSDYNVVSTTDSAYPIYVWFDTDSYTIYYYTEIEHPYVNSYGYDMFGYFNDIEDIEVDDFDTSKVQDFGHFFKNDSKVKHLNLSNFNTSSATNMSDMFKYMSSLEEIDVSSFDTSKVTNILDIFTGLTSIKELDMSSFDLSKITNNSSLTRDLTSLERLKTPKVLPAGGIYISFTLVDDDGNTYTFFNQDTPTETWLYPQ